MPCHSAIEQLRKTRRNLARDAVRLLESLVAKNSDVPGGVPRVRAALVGDKLQTAKNMVSRFNGLNAEIKRKKHGSY